MAFPKKISELPISGSLSNADLLAIVSGGVTSQTTLGDIAGAISGHSSPQFTGNTETTPINELWLDGDIHLDNSQSIMVKTNPAGVTSGILSMNSDNTTFIKGNGGGFKILDSGGIPQFSMDNGVGINSNATFDGNVNISGDTKLDGDLDLCDGGTLYVSTISGCPLPLTLTYSPITISSTDSVDIVSSNANISIDASRDLILSSGRNLTLGDLASGASKPSEGDVLASRDEYGNLEWGTPPVYQTTKELSTVDISTLNSVPVILIDPPGAGKFIQVNSCIIELTYGTASITGEDNIRLYTVSASTFLSGTEEGIGGENGFLGIAQDYRVYVHIQGDGFVRENSPLIATTGDAGDPDPTMNGSTSTVKFYINYSIITI